MPIIFQDLDSILFEWKQKVRMKTPEEKTGLFIYEIYRKNIDNFFINKINDLFKNINIKNVKEKKSEKTNKVTYVFNSKSKL